MPVILCLQDAKVVESASLALTRIAEATSRSPQHMDSLCNQGLIDSSMQLVAVSEGGSMTSQLAVSTYYGLLKLLCACAQGSPPVVETLFRADMSRTLRRLLSRCATPSKSWLRLLIASVLLELPLHLDLRARIVNIPEECSMLKSSTQQASWKLQGCCLVSQYRDKVCRCGDVLGMTCLT